MKTIYEVGVYLTFMYAVNQQMKNHGFMRTVQATIPMLFTAVLWPVYWSVLMLVCQVEGIIIERSQKES